MQYARAVESRKLRNSEAGWFAVCSGTLPSSYYVPLSSAHYVETTYNVPDGHTTTGCLVGMLVYAWIFIKRQMDPKVGILYTCSKESCVSRCHRCYVYFLLSLCAYYFELCRVCIGVQFGCKYKL